MSNHVKRFHAAVTVLAGHGQIKNRLVKAFERNLADIDDSELPLAVRESFSDLRQMMTRVAPLNGEGPICASVRKMSVVEADDCAHRMIDLYADMIRHGEDTQESLPLGADERPVVPPFLVKAN